MARVVGFCRRYGFFHLPAAHADLLVPNGCADISFLPAYPLHSPPELREPLAGCVSEECDIAIVLSLLPPQTEGIRLLAITREGWSIWVSKDAVTME